jgi:hypothetical protein
MPKPKALQIREESDQDKAIRRFKVWNELVAAPRGLRQVLTSTCDVVDVSALSLDSWLDLIDAPLRNRFVADYQFPTDELRDEYLKSIDGRTDEQIAKLLLRLLMPSCALNADLFLLSALDENRENQKKLLPHLRASYHGRRLLEFHHGATGILPWKGITWILDLVSYSPREAIAALYAYLLTHYYLLPDGRVTGLEDALAVIRARYLGTPASNAAKVSTLQELTSGNSSVWLSGYMTGLAMRPCSRREPGMADGI